MSDKVLYTVRGLHTFIGYDNSPTPYKPGGFTVGRVYARVHKVDTYPEDGGTEAFPPDSLFLNDEGIAVWETMDAFELVAQAD